MMVKLQSTHRPCEFPTVGVVEDEPVITVFDTGLLSRDKDLEGQEETFDRPWHIEGKWHRYIPRCICDPNESF